MHSILENTPNFVFLKDRQGRYALANDAFRRICGTDPIGRTPEELFPATAAARVEQQRRILQTGRAKHEEELLPSPDGPRHYLSIKFPVRDESGETTGLGCIGTDVTAL